MKDMAEIHRYPIGIFDSGIGGLTVAAAITRPCPGERLIYYGDTAHLPYGDKSEGSHSILCGQDHPLFTGATCQGPGHGLQLGLGFGLRSGLRIREPLHTCHQCDRPCRSGAQTHRRPTTHWTYRYAQDSQKRHLPAKTHKIQWGQETP